jgi:phosphoribosylformimino-5-aminoimidazole carboxamide ribonucleotide (ProFAR) isomerase
MYPARSGPKRLKTEMDAMASRLIPCLLLSHGHVCVPGPHGREVARNAAGDPLDPFDVLDRLSRDYPLLYLFDVDGVEDGQPQLDYLQELARDAPLWINSGVRTADQAIDALVTGARRAVLSTATLKGPEELQRSWKLSSEFVFEIEFASGKLSPGNPWQTTDPVELAGSVRSTGPDHIILSPRDADPDWSQVRRVAGSGPTWVGGTFSLEDAAALAESGAAGGIFQIGDLLAEDEVGAVPAPAAPLRTAPRDDED